MILLRKRVDIAVAILGGVVLMQVCVFDVVFVMCNVCEHTRVFKLGLLGLIRFSALNCSMISVHSYQL